MGSYYTGYKSYMLGLQLRLVCCLNDLFISVYFFGDISKKITNHILHLLQEHSFTINNKLKVLQCNKSRLWFLVGNPWKHRGLRKHWWNGSKGELCLCTWVLHYFAVSCMNWINEDSCAHPQGQQGIKGEKGMRGPWGQRVIYCFYSSYHKYSTSVHEWDAVFAGRERSARAERTKRSCGL